MANINWKDELGEMLDGDELNGINIAGTLYNEESLCAAFKRLENEFDDGYGGSEGEPFWAWSKEYVFFCAVYDGSEWISKVPRNPSDGKPRHIGGQ